MEWTHMGDVLEPARHEETCAALEVVLEDLLRVAKERRRRQELAHELEKEVGADAGLVGERVLLGEELDDRRDHAVAAQLEGGRTLDVVADVDQAPTHRRHEELLDMALGERVAREDEDELGICEAAGPRVSELYRSRAERRA